VQSEKDLSGKPDFIISVFFEIIKNPLKKKQIDKKTVFRIRPIMLKMAIKITFKALKK